MIKLLFFRIPAILILMFSFINSFAQSFEMKGFIRNSEGNALSFINIENHQNRFKTISNKFGAFKIIVNLGDSIEFHAIGYQSLGFVVKENNSSEVLNIKMIEKNYPLKTYNYKRNKNDSLARVYAGLMKKDSLLNDITRYTKFPKKAVLSLENGLVLRGLITHIWYNTSKKGKEMERLKLLSQLYQEEVKAEDKLSTEFIIQVCKVDIETAEEIKRNCKPGTKFVLLANEYDLAVYVMNCSKNLKKE
jgi:hypothetical protein